MALGVINVAFVPVAGAVSYRIKHRLSGTLSWITEVTEPTVSPYVINGVDTTLTYDVSVESNCGAAYSNPAITSAVISGYVPPDPTSTLTIDNQSSLALDYVNVGSNTYNLTPASTLQTFSIAPGNYATNLRLSAGPARVVNINGDIRTIYGGGLYSATIATAPISIIIQDTLF